jgi:DNA-binding PadR family transcriptional regulator
MFGRRHIRRQRVPWRREEEWSPQPDSQAGRRHQGFPHRRHGWRDEAETRWAARGHGRFGRHFHGGDPLGGDPFDEDSGGRGRRRRGDIKYVLLELLAEQPRHGYELMKELERRHAGFHRPSPGSVYPTLQMLEDEGHLTSELVDGKRIYTITESGRGLLEARQERHAAEGFGPPWGAFRRESSGPELDTLRRSGMALFEGVMQVARHGTPEQIRATMALLDTTRREIYAILAKGSDDQPA